MGENQRKPKPQLERRLVSGKSFTQGSSETSAQAGFRRQYCCSKLYALPTSVNTTPRMPILSKMGISISALPSTRKLPPMGKVRRGESGYMTPDWVLGTLIFGP